MDQQCSAGARYGRSDRGRENPPREARLAALAGLDRETRGAPAGKPARPHGRECWKPARASSDIPDAGPEPGFADDRDRAVARQLREPVRQRAPLMCQAPGTWPAAYSLIWRTSMTVGASGGARPASSAGGTTSSRRAADLDRAPGRGPCLEPALEVAGDLVAPDRRRLAMIGGPGPRGVRGASTTGWSRSTARPSQVPNDGPEPDRGRDGTRAAAWSAAGRASTSVAPATTLRSEPRPDPAASASGTPPPSSGGPGLVRRAHPGEVARDRRLAGQQRPREVVDVHRGQQRVVATARGRWSSRTASRDPRRASDPAPWVGWTCTGSHERQQRCRG